MSKKVERQRVSRKELRRQQVERDKRMRALRVWIPIGVLAVALAAFVIIRLTEPEVEGAIFVEREPAGAHDVDAVIESGDLPPTGGLHSPVWQNCGIYTEPVDNANAVHSLEHGAVWITYQPELSADQVELLQDMVRGQSHLLLSPYPGQRSEVVLTAWDVQLELDFASDERIEEFIDKYRNTRGPEPGASCSNGTGTPLD